jgi:sortase A
MAVLAAILLFAGGGALLGEGLFIRAKAVVAQILLENAWAETVATGKPAKAWSWADTWPVARMEFPSLERSTIVLAQGGGEAMAFGPAHVLGTPLPGDDGISVVGGHRDTHFRFIKNLKTGDEIDVTKKNGEIVRFVVTGTAIVHAGSSGINPQGSTPRLALVTCYPFDGLTRGPMRYIVFAEALSPAKPSLAENR